ncbi:MAG: ABC transporter ATP-binding protein [Sandaracinaceae bacterium]|jgi:lipoprotein-releasing system ATP-binding protein|nr:ABC transporter ATP-binding protein [Sandaracinaceae bacterium]
MAEPVPTDTPPVLRCTGLIKEFGTDPSVRVLHGIDLSVAAGEFVALVGPSGSGKSTLLNILGLLDVPTAGELWVQGVPTTALDDGRRTALRGSALGFVFQFHHLLPTLRAWENVALPMAAVQGRMKASMRARAEVLLRQVDLGDKIDAPAGELSGGQQQRVALARALAQKPAVVLADEPTGNLDTVNAARVFEVMRQHHAEAKTAFIIVTHDLALAARCDRVVQLVDGRVSYDGAAGDAFLAYASEQLRAT